jgi:hypothetical protein
VHPLLCFTGRAAAEKQSLAGEISMIIDKARSNTELLSDMLVNSGGRGDEFEQELVADLTHEVGGLCVDDGMMLF